MKLIRSQEIKVFDLVINIIGKQSTVAYYTKRSGNTSIEAARSAHCAIGMQCTSNICMYEHDLFIMYTIVIHKLSYMHVLDKNTCT